MGGLMGASLVCIGIHLSKRFSYLLRSAGMVCCMLGVLCIMNFLTLHGFLTLSSRKPTLLTASVPQLEGGYQVIEMRAEGTKQFVVKKDMPVKWVIDGENVAGCQGMLVSPKLGIQTAITEGENVIEFTPKEKGTIAFACGMGLYRGALNVM